MNENSIKQFFFEAMKQGYTSSPPKGTIKELPGSKVITFEKDSFKLVDYWLVGGRYSSFGNTIIFYRNVPVWTMNYWGWYDEKVIDFLKQSLRQEYERDYDFKNMEFGEIPANGFRGPRFYIAHGFLYVNRLQVGSSFYQFKGREEIFDSRLSETFYGYHEYSGFMLAGT